jgi:hypothetical protein
MRGIMLHWTEFPEASTASDAPENWGASTLLCSALITPVRLFLTLHIFNIIGKSNLQPPKPHSKDELEHSQLLQLIQKGPELLWADPNIPAHARPDLTKLMPPSADDAQHLAEWLEAADYATSALVLMAGIWGLDCGCIPPPEGNCLTSCCGCQSRTDIPCRLRSVRYTNSAML